MGKDSKVSVGYGSLQRDKVEDSKVAKPTQAREVMVLIDYNISIENQVGKAYGQLTPVCKFAKYSLGPATSWKRRKQWSRIRSRAECASEEAFSGKTTVGVWRSNDGRGWPVD
jgi:hypothetical protein